MFRHSKCRHQGRCVDNAFIKITQGFQKIVCSPKELILQLIKTSMLQLFICDSDSVNCGGIKIILFVMCNSYIVTPSILRNISYNP
jgi:hypothetical protein